MQIDVIALDADKEKFKVKVNVDGMKTKLNNKKSNCYERNIILGKMEVLQKR